MNLTNRLRAFNAQWEPNSLAFLWFVIGTTFGAVLLAFCLSL